MTGVKDNFHKLILILTKKGLYGGVSFGERYKGRVGQQQSSNSLLFSTSFNSLPDGGMTMRRLWMAIFILLIFMFWNAPVGNAQFREAGVEKLRVAVDAPEFTLKELGGGKISLKELRGKIILLNFFASW
ncbi:MAG: AhpC/TSA family [Deltaproteobacteria bacterium]|jgi:hypothetical protein|nr:AhpC/TSA family [Deltaproteobacteria bacterium]